MILPAEIRRRQRTIVFGVAGASVAFFLAGIYLCWMGAGMMIGSDRFCMIMQPCRDAKLARYNIRHTPLMEVVAEKR